MDLILTTLRRNLPEAWKDAFHKTVDEQLARPDYLKRMDEWSKSNA